MNTASHDSPSSSSNPASPSPGSSLSGMRGVAAKVITGLAALTAPVALTGCFQQSSPESAATQSIDQENVVAVKLAQAQEVMNLFLEGKDVEFIAQGTEQVQAGLSAEQLQLMRAAVADQHGDLLGEGSNGHMIIENHDVYDFTINYDRGHIDYRLSFDQDGKMAGFFVIGSAHTHVGSEG